MDKPEGMSYLAYALGIGLLYFVIRLGLDALGFGGKRLGQMLRNWWRRS